jgi:VWFA-related protein
VIVDVVVTDKHGQPVHSIDKSHFQVMENGASQQVSFFEEHNAASDTASTPPPAKPELPPGVYSNVENVPARGALVVVLLDAMNTPLGSQAYVRQQMLDYLKQVPAGTHMAIFTLGDKLQLVQGFTSDPAVLKAAMSKTAYPGFTALKGLTGGAGSGAAATQGSVLNGMGGAASNLQGLGLAGVSLGFASSVAMTRSSLAEFTNESGDFSQELRVRFTIDALNAMAVYLDGIPGRKNLVWFTGQVPWTVNPDFSLATGVTGREDYSDELRKLADVMTLGRIAIYPIDAVGLVTPPGYSADTPNSAFGGRGAGGAFGAQEMNAQMNLAGNHMSMSNLAAATGGQAIYNTNGLSEAIVKVQSIGENFYTLAYSPTNKLYDGSFRELQVKISDPGLKLEYRRGYYAEDPAKAAGRTLIVHSSPLRAVMQRGAPDATQIPFHVAVREAPQQPSTPADRVGNQGATLKGPVVRYDFHWTVNIASLAFEPLPNGLQHGEVDAAITVYDGEGTVLNNIYAVLPLNLRTKDYNTLLKSGLPMKQTLDLPAGGVFVRAGIVDPANGRTGATEFPFLVQVQKQQAANSASFKRGQM